MTPIDAYRAIQESTGAGRLQPEVRPDKAGKGGADGSFQTVLGDLVRQVNGLQQDADKSIQGLVTGETTNVHDVTTRMAEAGLAFDLMMEVRNKLLDAYQQVIRMQA